MRGRVRHLVGEHELWPAPRSAERFAFRFRALLGVDSDHLAAQPDLDPPFVSGAEVTHWNGTPIRRAIERNADRQGGGNLDARMARGLDALTIRALGQTAPPDEDSPDAAPPEGVES